MELTCRQCSAKFRAAVSLPLVTPVRVACPTCGKQMVLRPAPEVWIPPSDSGPAPVSKPIAVIADEPRDFRRFLGEELQQMGFEVHFFEGGDAALELVRHKRAELVILNVYLKGKLGVEISEEIKADPKLGKTRVVLIGALFRANRFRANPTNLYGADEYIEEQIPAKELRRIVKKLFPHITSERAAPVESREYDDARRLARLILSDIVIYNADKVEQGIRAGNFFDILEPEIREGREYYESRVPLQIRQHTEFFDEVLQQFVEEKRDELGRPRTGTGGRS